MPAQVLRQAEAYLQDLAAWEGRWFVLPAAEELAPTGDPGETHEPSPAEALRLFEQQICQCTRCCLSQSRTRFVFGTGDPQAGILFIGEGPGQEEDLQGEPFVGPAGQLLDRIIGAMGMRRDQVYIANMVKCRPPGNRDPSPDELEACRPYLDRQIEIIRPRVICTLGRIAAQALLSSAAPLGRLRGRLHSYRGIPVVCTYHPAALLRSPEYKRPTWEDIKLLRRQYDGVEL
ncbi:MAG: uracil-DNA glycosylase [Candidatus Latescibacterota bacterium]